MSVRAIPRTVSQLVSRATRPSKTVAPTQLAGGVGEAVAETRAQERMSSHGRIVEDPRLRRGRVPPVSAVARSTADRQRSERADAYAGSRVLSPCLSQKANAQPDLRLAGARDTRRHQHATRLRHAGAGGNKRQHTPARRLRDGVLSLHLDVVTRRRIRKRPSARSWMCRPSPRGAKRRRFRLQTTLRQACRTP